jgi:hypothetical protein
MVRKSKEINKTEINLMKLTSSHFNRRHAVVCLILNIKWRYSVQTEQQHTIISTAVWLHVSVFSRTSSGQYLPVEGTIGGHYTLWDSIQFTGCA